MRVIAVMVLIIITSPVFGQVRDSVVLKEVTVHANRLFEKETAGGKETRVDSLVLSENLNHTLSELLAETTPIFIKSYGRGSMATASFRGTAPSHTQVLWNGMSINSPMLGMVDFSLLPVYFIDDLSLKHGGASIQDIGGALGGSVSIQNKPDWDNTLSARYVQGVGSFATSEEFGQVNFGNQKFQSKTRAYYTHSKNDFPFINDQLTEKPLQRNGHADYTMYSVMQELYGRIDARNQVSLNAWYHNANRSIPKLHSNESPDDTNINTQDDRTWKLQGSWDHHYQSGTITASSGLNLQHLDYFLVAQVLGQGPASRIYSISKATSQINRVQLKHDFSATSSLNFSANYNYHSVHTADSVEKTGYDKTRNEVLLYASYYKTFRDRLNIRASVRQDYVDDRFIPVIPYFGFDYKLFKDEYLYLKGNITRNYHVPSLNDLYWQPGGNPTLQPEQGVTQELTVAFLRNVSTFHLESQLTGYHSDITNWILWVPTQKGYWEPHNVRKVISKGVELAVKAKFNVGKIRVTVNGSYAYTESKNFGDRKTWGDASYGKQLVYIPIHSGNMFLSMRYRTYTLTWQHSTYSRRYTTSSNDLTERASGLPTYFMNELYVSKDFTLKKVSFTTQLKAYNLFDEYYRSVLGRRMPGRNYMLLLLIRYQR